MNLKSLLLLAAIGTVSTSVSFAQTGNVKKAKSALAKFQELKDAGTVQLGISNLKSAKEAIDAAVVNDKTKANAEAWTVYALVNANLSTIDKSSELAKLAEDGIARAKQLDTDGANKANITVAEQILGQYNFNLGAEAYQAQKYAESYSSFTKALTYLPGDTLVTYYSGVAALSNKDYKNAVERYKELIPRKDFSSHKTIMVDLPKLYLSMQDTTSALEYAKKAAEAYPDDNAAMTQNIELNLITGHEKETIDAITAQLAKDPNNKSLNYYLGIAQSSAKNEDAAVAAYKKALEIDPNFFEANTNLAITLMNKTREKLNVVNNNRKLTQAQYDAELNKIKAELKPVLPYLEKAVSLQPKNVDALTNLKNYYIFMQDEAKTAEINAKIKEVE